MRVRAEKGAIVLRCEWCGKSERHEGEMARRTFMTRMNRFERGHYPCRGIRIVADAKSLAADAIKKASQRTTTQEQSETGREQ